MADIFDELTSGKPATAPKDVFDEVLASPDFFGAAGGEQRAFDFADSIIRNAPAVAGDIAGAYVGSKIPGGRSLMGPRMVNLFKTGMGGAVGAMGGELAAQQQAGEPLDVEKIKEQGAMGLGGNLGIGGFVAAMRPAVKFARPVLDPLFKLATDLTVVGSRRKLALRQRLLTETTEDAERFVYDVAPEAIKKADVGIDSIRVKMQTALDENKSVYAAYKPAIDAAAERDGGIVVNNTQEWLLQKMRAHEEAGNKPGTFLRDVFGYSPSAKEERDIVFALKNVMKSIDAGGPIAAADFNTALARVYGAKWERVGHEVWKDNRAKLKELLLEDLQGYPEAFALKTSADDTMRAVNQYKFLYNKIFSPAIKDDALNPKKLAENIYLHKSEIMSRSELKELWPALEKKARMYSDVADTLDRTKPVINFSGIQPLGGVLGFAGMGPYGAAAAETFGLISAYALVPQMSKTALQRVVSTGAEALTKTGLRVGNEYVNFDNAGGE